MSLISKDPDVSEALRSCRSHFASAAIFNIGSNILVLAYPLFMLSVYQRVMESGSLATLLALFTGFAIAVAFRALFEWIRPALMSRAGLRLDRRLSERLVEALFRRRAAGREDTGAQTLRDLDAFRQFATGRGGVAAMDAPWAGLFIALMFILDPLVGVVALVALLVLMALEAMKVGATQGKVGQSNRSSVSSYVALDLALPSAEAVIGMGMLPGMLRSWRVLHEDATAAQDAVRNRAAALDSLEAGANLLFQGAIISTAAIQFLRGEAPGGLVFVSSMLFQFAMRPAQRMITIWTDYIPVRQGLARIEEVFRSVPPRREKIPLPRPRGVLTVKAVTYVPSGSNKPVLRNLNFGIDAGMSLGVVGLMGAGKTTLARLLVGCMRPSAGTVRLDGSDVWDWVQSGSMRHIGYLPQAIGLLPGTVAENIGRLGDFDEVAIVAAAKLAGVHDLILRLPRGYDTLIGPGGYPISGGQKQLVGLARAVVGNPSLVVLDEPNSNLDGPGEDALRTCVRALEKAGTTLVMISHRSDLVQQMKRVVLLREGEVVGFGETEAVYRKLGRPVIVKAKASHGA